MRRASMHLSASALTNRDGAWILAGYQRIL